MIDNPNFPFKANNFAWEWQVIGHKNEYIRTSGQPAESGVSTVEDEHAEDVQDAHALEDAPALEDGHAP